MQNLNTRDDTMEKTCTVMRSELTNLTKFQYHSSYALRQDMDAMMKWANIKRGEYDWPYPDTSYPGYKAWFEKSGFLDQLLLKKVLGIHMTSVSLGLAPRMIPLNSETLNSKCSNLNLMNNVLLPDVF